MADRITGFGHLTPENRHLLDLTMERDRLYRLEPESLIPVLFRPCRVRVLLVADGGLDFSVAEFGLRAFVETLLGTGGIYVRFEITLAHIDNVSGGRIMDGDPRIARRIPSFKFDDPAHFGRTMYDQVWLFGIQTAFFNRGAGYPTNRLSDAELAALTDFMNHGGGLFATGDHGALGRALGGAVPRARSMRLWDDTTPNNATNEVSMSGPRRNDTNRLGHDPASQFNDQSDDIPQTIQPTLYYRRTGFWRAAFPHPLLCSPRGVIRVLPDHPHEGECFAPTTLTDQEYPPASGAWPRPRPEVIATASVLAGMTAGTKQATQAHSFGVIAAYDGHRARVPSLAPESRVGRVVTDSTWHHFVNVNITGDIGPLFGTMDGDPKRVGFLATPAGEAHLEEIKTYYRNIAVWISRPAQIDCMNWRLSWGLIWHHRVLEAVLSRMTVRLQQLDLSVLFEIGRHARDVLNNYAGQCQSNTLILDLIRPYIREDVILELDPWIPKPEKGPPPPDPVPWVNTEVLLDLALGGALLALREEFPDPDPDDRDRIEAAVSEVIGRGVRYALDAGIRSLTDSADRATALVAGGRPRRQRRPERAAEP